MCLVSGDPGRLQQIIWNLLTNAIKFTPKGGRVEVRLDRVDSHTEITISDTGQGIAPEFIRHVFERFRQSDASSTRTHGGLGLGLSIVSQLVELHGGTITASSPGKGLGTSFKVELPLLSIHQDNSVFKRTSPVVSRIPLTDQQLSLTHLRVLVVDDELDSLDLIAAVLMGIAALITGSRGGMLSLLGVVAFVVAVNLIRSKAREEDDEELELSSLRKNLLLIGGAAALLLVLIGSVLLLGGDQELLRGIGLTSSDDISSGRLHFWKTTLQIFFHNPILGVGLNAFATAYPQYDSWNGNLRVENAHNDYLQVLAEMGVVGFVAIVGFIFLLFKSGVTTIGHTADRLRRDVAIGSLAGCFGILIHSFFDFPLRTTSNALFFLLLCAFAVRKRLGRTAL